MNIVFTAFSTWAFTSVYTSIVLERLGVGADSSNLVLELVGVLDLEVLSVGGKDELVTRLNLGLLGGLPRQLVLGVQGAGEGSSARSSSSYSALSVCTSTTILLDLARMFLELEMTVHVLRDLVVSALLPVVELLRSGVCSHLVSLPHNVGLDDLDSVVPVVNDKLVHGVLSCRT